MRPGKSRRPPPPWLCRAIQNFHSTCTRLSSANKPKLCTGTSEANTEPYLKACFIRAPLNHRRITLVHLLAPLCSRPQMRFPAVLSWRLVLLDVKHVSRRNMYGRQEWCGPLILMEIIFRTENLLPGHKTWTSGALNQQAILSLFKNLWHSLSRLLSSLTSWAIGCCETRVLSANRTSK